MENNVLISIRKKLASRKFWTMIGGISICLMTYFGVDADTIQKASSIIGIAGTAIAYICVEGAIDKSSIIKSASEVVEVVTKTDLNGDGIIGESEGDK